MPTMRVQQLVVAAVLLSLPCMIFAVDCIPEPVPLVTHIDTAWSSVIFGCPVIPLAADEITGPSKTNIAHLTIPAGHGFPPHRHPGKEEYLYITGGTGEVKVLVEGAKSPEVYAVREGSFHRLPDGAIHTVAASATEDLKMIIFTTPGKFIIETFEEFPDSTDIPVDHTVDILSYLDNCPPGRDRESAKTEL